MDYNRWFVVIFASLFLSSEIIKRGQAIATFEWENKPD